MINAHHFSTLYCRVCSSMSKLDLNISYTRTNPLPKYLSSGVDGVDVFEQCSYCGFIIVAKCLLRLCFGICSVMVLP